MSSSLSALLWLCLNLSLSLSPSSAKVFERCELAQLLQRQYGLPSKQAATLVCIAQHSSDLNTAAYGGGSGPGGGSHGLFQISDVYWCSPPGQGAGCGLSCARLRDENIADDVLCVRKIYAEHQRLTGDGFSAWNAYQQYCQHDAVSYIADCHQQPQQLNKQPIFQASSQHPNAVAPQYVPYVPRPRPRPQPSPSKIYSRCELAQELYYQHRMPMQQIPTWVCIAQHESSFNTAAVGRLNADGSADHGLFQISDLYWCSHEAREGGKGCRTTCDKFLDTNIADDVQCIKRIHQEHTGISGDGFNAWTVYNRNCRNQRYEQVAACFAKPQAESPSYTHPNAISGSVAKLSYNQAQIFAKPPPAKSYYKTPPAPANAVVAIQSSSYYKAPAPANAAVAIQSSSSSYQGNPFLRPHLAQPQHPNAIGPASTPANPFHKYTHYSSSYTQQQQQQHFYTTTKTGRRGKVYNRCELAQDLYFSHKFPMQDIATWVCIAQHESRLDTAAVGRLNADGSADHGLFQISDLYWCSHAEEEAGGKGCHIGCDKLLDADISDDVQCIRTIHEEHTRLSGDGFTAWTVYNPHCRQRSKADISDCFDKNVLEKEQVKPVVNNEVKVSRPKAKGKIYNRCELAKELYHKHKLPMREIPTWVCIAEHESSFNTAAVGRLNADGSADHGLFQISDLYWCEPGSQSGKACHIGCDKFLDADISDDVQCIKTIHEEHTRLSGDGFTAWTVYNGHCRQRTLAELSDCFDGNEISNAVSKPGHHDEKPQLPPKSRIQQPQITMQVAADHAYASNLFLQRLITKQTPTGTAVQSTKAPTQTTRNPLQAVANHPYAANPFLQHQPSAYTKPKLQPTPQASSTSISTAPSYAHNPFLKGQNANAIKNSAQTKPHSESSNNKDDLHLTFNPFLSKVNPTSSTPPKQFVQSTKAPHQPIRPYISSDSFRHELIKFTATSLSTTARPTTTTTAVKIPSPIYTSHSLQVPKSTTTTTIRPLTAAITTARPSTTPFYNTIRPYITLNRSTTARTTTRPTTTANQTTRSTTIRSTTRSTTTAKQTTRATTTAPTRPTTTRSTTIRSPTTTRPITTRPFITRYSTTARPYSITTTTNRPSTARTTTRPTTFEKQRTRSTTTRSTTNRSTTRPTTTRPPITRFSTTDSPSTARTSNRSATTTRQTTRSVPTSKRTPITARPSSPIYIPTTPKTTTRATLRSTTTTRPFTANISTTRTAAPFSTTPTKRTTRTPTTTTRGTTRSPTTSRPSSSITRQSSIAGHRSSTPTATPRPRLSTTPKPYLFTSKTTTTRTTHRPPITTTTTQRVSTASPFDHPFFDKFRAQFGQNRGSSTTLSPKPKNQTSTSPYYAKFQQSKAKAVFAYDFGQNRTLSGIATTKTIATTTKPSSAFDIYLKSNNKS